jgi:hypothetical protein
LSPAAENTSFLGDDSASTRTFNLTGAICIWLHKCRRKHEDRSAVFTRTTFANAALADTSTTSAAADARARFSTVDYNESG